MLKVGDVCELLSAPNIPVKLKGFIGQECTITSVCPEGCIGKKDFHIRFAHSVGSYCAISSVLRKKRPPATYDGNQAGDWDLCPFKPAVPVEIER